MVRLVCLDDEVTANLEARFERQPVVVKEDARYNPNVNGFSEALGCYPIVSQLACMLDLNTLHDLSRTCRQFRANLFQYRTMLKTLTLRCENELPEPPGNLPEDGQGLTTAQLYNQPKRSGRFTGGKVGPCARDMVGECRKCSKIVCRNCIAKPPHPRELKGRHRRLCKVCMKSPINRHTSVTLDDDESTIPSESFTYAAFARTPCTCPSTVWLCQPCGLESRQADTNHQRSVNWRIRYSACGGIGAGLGEGNEGVECGRRHACLAAQDVYREYECGADELVAEDSESPNHEHRGCSYMTQEIVGIGGQLKTKVTEKVRVGQAVKHYEDERSTGRYLSREQNGLNRSWCSWCARVIPRRKNLQNPAGQSTESVASSSSSSTSN